MRLTGLLAVLLFLLLVFFVAPAASFAQTASGQGPVVVHARSTDELKAMRSLAGENVWELERDGVCYTLRTYVVARDEKDSDATHVVREARCLPASKLQFKTATEPVRRMDLESR
jgi:hypothetical protein